MIGLVVERLVEAVLARLVQAGLGWINTPDLGEAIKHAWVSVSRVLFANPKVAALSTEQQESLNSFLGSTLFPNAAVSYMLSDSEAFRGLKDSYPSELKTALPFNELILILQEPVRRYFAAALGSNVVLWIWWRQHGNGNSVSDALFNRLESWGQSGLNTEHLEQILSVLAELKRGTHLLAQFSAADALVDIARQKSSLHPTQETLRTLAMALGNKAHFHAYVDTRDQLPYEMARTNVFAEMESLYQETGDPFVLKELLTRRGDAEKICGDNTAASADLEQLAKMGLDFTELGYGLRCYGIIAGRIDSSRDAKEKLATLKRALDKGKAPNAVLAHGWDGVAEGYAECFKRYQDPYFKSEAWNAYNTACELHELTPWEIPSASLEGSSELERLFPEFRLRTLRLPALLAESGVININREEQEQWLIYPITFAENIGSLRTAVALREKLWKLRQNDSQ